MDDIILLSPSIGNLQLLLRFCVQALDYLEKTINSKNRVVLDLS